MEELLRDLTEAQRAAVTHGEGPLLVLAGPGSGKTRVITRRVAYLIGQGVRPGNILAITFTNKAADEMAGRVRALAAPRGATICTFHRLAARLLREFADRAALPANFSIYDEADQRAAVRDALAAVELDRANYPPARALARISHWKNDLETPEQAAARAQDFASQRLAAVYAAYQKELAKNAALDFDDLLLRLALLLRDDAELRDRLNDRYRYVLADEYQDTNHAQYQMARGLTLKHRNLCATGDPDQSIYGWRGADIGNILAFEEDYPDAKIVRLEENFRSTPEVLALADELIRFNRRRKAKRLFTARPGGVQPRLLQSADEHEEAARLVEWIAELRRQGREYRDLAVFYRVNWMSRVLEEALRRGAVPYQIIRGLEFFQRAEIKDVLAYLRLLINPADALALKRVINQPPRGIGATTAGRVLEQSAATGRDVWQVLRQVEAAPGLSAAAQAKVKKFVELIELLQGRLGQPVAEILRATYQQSGLAAAHAAAGDEDAADNVAELINSAAEYDAQAPTPALAEYLQQIALVSDADAYDENAGAVALMTLHAAKGLEFPAVFIAGIEDGLLPHSRSRDSEEDVEEERRLLFVGVTRAKDVLCLSYARQRSTQGKTQMTICSPFLRPLTHLLVCPDGASPSADAEEDQEDDETSQAAADDAPRSVWSCGQLVRHPKFGLGRVRQVRPGPDEGLVVVQFNTAGAKTLAVKYAPLERVNG